LEVTSWISDETVCINITSNIFLCRIVGGPRPEVGKITSIKIPTLFPLTLIQVNDKDSYRVILAGWIVKECFHFEVTAKSLVFKGVY
jgi:hypothetical protein